MERPDFDSIKNFEEFSKYYWYRDELKKICKEHGLKSPTGKIQLNEIIKSYFSGQIVRPEKKSRKKVKAVSELSLKTGLIECGFNFGQKFRAFFEEQTGKSPFKFNVDMVATARAVKESDDESFTLGDLLDVYYGKKSYAKYDKSALQWNKFVKDFCADEATSVYKNRMKAAAKLWKIVRESDGEKIYTHELFKAHEKDLE